MVRFVNTSRCSDWTVDKLYRYMNALFPTKFIFILKLVNKGPCPGGWGLIGSVLAGCMPLPGLSESANFLQSFK